MTVPGSTNELLLRSAAAAYTVQRSLRFNSADTAYLSRTPASAGNRKTWTWSGWLKRCGTGNMSLVDAGTSTAFRIRFTSEQLDIASNATIYRRTAAVLRDFSAWYHIVIVLDTTQATASNRVKVYINGQEITTFSTSNDPTLNEEFELNNNVAHTIGTLTSAAGNFFNGYLADIHFIDGQAKTPSDFAETNATTGQWVPKLYSGTYGTNGFKLTFSDNSNTTAATLGADTSGNGNNWTPNNFSVTAGAGNDSLRDTPTSGGTDTGVGGEVRGNYCTWNALTPIGPYPLTLANGNLEAKNACGTFSLTSGKWYWEIATQAPVGGAYPVHGLYATSVPIAYPANSPGIGIGADGTTIYIFGSTGVTLNVAGSFTSTAWAANDIIMFAFDADSKKIWMGRNGTWYNSGAPASGTGHVATMMTAAFYSPGTSNENYTGSCTANFGQRAWAYTAPSGFKALCDTNLTAPTIAKPNTVIDTVLYTGNGSSSRAITGLNFSPDFVWAKSRNQAYSHYLFDIVRGANKALFTDTVDSQQTYTSYLLSFDSAGFTVGNGSQINANGDTYVGWTWDAGSSNATNTNGTITSTVRANTTAGFSVVNYTGTFVNATVGHGLAVAPELIICKSMGAADDWASYWRAIGNTKSIRMTEDAPLTITAWNNTTPTSTVFSIGQRDETNRSGTQYIAYCWTPVSGISSFGQYTGNGSTDGPHINVGFRPAVIIVKRSSSIGAWTILDDKREGYNVDNDPLFPNTAGVEGTTDLVDITSNGFKIRTTDATFNFNTGTYVYAAWASAPFPYARAR